MIHESHQKSYQYQAGTNSHLVVQFDTGTQVEVKHRVVDQGLDQIENRFILSPSDKQCKLPGCPKDSHIVVLQTFA